jgi:hypothetical protein
MAARKKVAAAVSVAADDFEPDAYVIRSCGKEGESHGNFRWPLDAGDEFKIEKDIPLSESRSGPRPKYPFASMEVGDSFFIPGDRSSRSVSGSVSHWRKSHPKQQFATRKVENGLRVWRIEDRPASKDAAE